MTPEERADEQDLFDRWDGLYVPEDRGLLPLQGPHPRCQFTHISVELADSSHVVHRSRGLSGLSLNAN